MAEKKTLLSGVKPTGELHLGNYFGAMRQFVQNQDEYNEYIFIPDYHALTSLHDPQALREAILHTAAGYLAIGLDPERVTFYQQSRLSQHTELAWVFECLTTMPELMRAHAFKDAEARDKDINVGVFNYPLLMAADILLYDVDVVPVGKDQAQHLEIARDSARAFNNTFGETFKEPQGLILDEVAVVPGVDGQKMSKSYKNVIPLFANADVITKQVMSIVTDSAGGRPENVYNIHKLLKSEAELEKLYSEHEGNYKTLKEALIVDIEELVAPMRERYTELRANESELIAILERGAEKARAQSENKMEVVRERIGVSL